MATMTAGVRDALVNIYIGMFKAAPGLNDLNSMVASYEAGMTQKEIAASLANADFVSVYPTALLNSEFADELVNFLLGSGTTLIGSSDKAWATNWMLTQLNAGVSRSSVIVMSVNALSAATNVAYADAKAQLANKLAVAKYYALDEQQSSTDLAAKQAIIDGVTNVASTVTAAISEIDSGVAEAIGQAIALTAGVDTVVGTVGNDDITANESTMSALDTINGGDGADTLTVYGVDTAGAAADVTLSDLKSVSNVESLTVITDATKSIAVATTVAAWTGLTSASFDLGKLSASTAITAGATDVTVSFIDDNGGDFTVTGGKAVSVTSADTAASLISAGGTTATSVSLTGGLNHTIGGSAITTATSTKAAGTVGVTDSSKAGTVLTTLTVDSATGAITTTTTKGLTTVNLTNSNGGATLGTAAGTRALTLNLNKLTAGTITDANATSVDVNASGTATTGVTLAVAAAKDVTLGGSIALTLTSLNAAAMTDLTVDGSKVTTVSGFGTTNVLTDVTVTGAGGLTADVSGQSALLLIDASASTGANTLVVDGSDQVYKGGAGVDSVTVSAAPAVSLDGGAGSADILGINAVADLSTLTSVTLSKAANFEVLQLSGAVGTAADVAKSTLDLSGLPSSFSSAVSLKTTTAAENLIFKNAAATSSITYLSNFNKDATITLKADGKSDVLNVTLGDTTTKAAINTNAGTLTAAQFDTVKFHALGTLAAGGYHTTKVAAVDAKNLVIDGTAGIYFNNGVFTKAATVDAVNLKGVLWTLDLALTTGVTVNAGNYGGWINTSEAATKVSTITLGDGGWGVTANSGDNVITVGNVADTNANGYNSVSVGSGDNIITLGNVTGSASGQYAYAGDGNNTISMGNNEGSGGDYMSISVGSGDNVITMGYTTNDGASYAYVYAGDGNNTITVGDFNGTYSTSISVGSGDNTISLGDTGNNAAYAYVYADDGENSITVGDFAGTSYVSISVGSGDNVITLGNITDDATGAYVYTDGGNNTITVGSNAATNYSSISVGDGDNVITTGAGDWEVYLESGTNTVTFVGAGDNTVYLNDNSAGLNKINVGTGTDTIDFNNSPSAAGYYASITGMGTGDVFDFVDAVNNAGGTSANIDTLASKITLGANSSFANYLDAASAGGGNTATWFQFNGSTYIVVDTNAGATFQDGLDVVVELTGLVTLTGSTMLDGVLTLA